MTRACKIGSSQIKSYARFNLTRCLFGQSQEINLILEKKGFQFRDEKGVWKPTSSGKEFCLQIGNQFNKVKWKLETILK
jgi:hypothetical protein